MSRLRHLFTLGSGGLAAFALVIGTPLVASAAGSPAAGTTIYVSPHGDGSESGTSPGRADVAPSLAMAQSGSRSAPAASRPGATGTLGGRPYMGNTQDHTVVNVFEQSIPLQAGKTVEAVTLPDISASVVRDSPSLHVFAMAIGG